MPLISLDFGMYQPRTYRHWIKDTDLTSFSVTVEETDLYIRARRNLRKKALKAALKYRNAVERYIERHPEFLVSLEPVTVHPDAPRIVRNMSRAAEAVSLGPMAAVAGAIAEEVGRELLTYSPEIIVENGGDIFMVSTRRRFVGVYAGSSPFSGKIALQIEPENTPLGVCTSSGTVGHSLSLGTADAVIVLSGSAALADAAATAIGNRVSALNDIGSAIEFSRTITGIKGVLVIKDDRMGMWGSVQIVKSG